MKHLLALFLLLPALWACSSSDTAGATSETTNGIALKIVDASQKPVAQARVTLYSKTDLSKLDSAVSDSFGLAYVNYPAEDCYLEGIAGSDSSLMVWDEFDSTRNDIALKPSASVVIRTEMKDSLATLQLRLEGTPYAALWLDSAFVFSHVPAGIFSLALGTSVVAEMALEAGVKIDTALTFAVSPDTLDDSRDTVVVKPDTIQLDSAGILTFEDFDDGDSLSNLAKFYPNYGWYFTVMGDCQWIRPDDAAFTTALDSSDERGRYLSTKFDIGDSGMVILGSNIGSDSVYYDMSGLKEIYITLRGDGEVSVALEHYKEISKNNFNKSMWKVETTDQWTEFVLKPGEEVVDEKINQVEWNEISKEISLFSIFIQDGTFLEVDKIVFVGVNFVYYAP